MKLLLFSVFVTLISTQALAQQVADQQPHCQQGNSNCEAEHQRRRQQHSHDQQRQVVNPCSQQDTDCMRRQREQQQQQPMQQVADQQRPTCSLEESNGSNPRCQPDIRTFECPGVRQGDTITYTTIKAIWVYVGFNKYEFVSAWANRSTHAVSCDTWGCHPSILIEALTLPSLSAGEGPEIAQYNQLRTHYCQN